MPVGWEELARFNRGLAEMVRSGVPLPEAIRQLAGDVDSRRMRRVLERVESAVRDGADLRAALEPHRAELPAAWLGMVEAGARSGALADVLENFAHYAEAKLAFRRRVREALGYPALSAAFIVPLLLVTLFVAGPVLVKMDEDAGDRSSRPLKRFLASFVPPRVERPTAFPRPTGFMILLRRALSAADALSAHPVPAAAGALVLGIAIAAAVRALRRSARASGMVLRLPLAGPLMRFELLGTSLRCLASLVRSGVPLPEALDLAAAAADHPLARERLRLAAAGTREGASLSGALTDDPLFPAYVAWLLSKDEGGPRFADALGQAADHYLGLTERRAESLKLLVLPVAEVILGLVVFASFVTFVLPWYI